MGRERALSEDLAKLSETVTKWRAEHGGRGKKIPEEMWSETVRVARSDGVWLTAKATRFKYDALKQRLAHIDGESPTAPHETRPPSSARGMRRRRAKQRMRTSKRARAGATEFVELSAAQLLGTRSTMSTVVEVEDKAGTRMIVRLAREAQLDEVARLIVAFGRRDA